MKTIFTISLKKADGSTILSESAENEVYAVHNTEYEEGDFIEIQCQNTPCYAVVQLDQCLQPNFVYFKDNFKFAIPFNEKKLCYPQQSFSGQMHYIHIRTAREEEISVRKNLALNVCDSHTNSSFFPHASANIETRGESVFAARNAIDGCIANSSHGDWPFASWGINRDPKAQLKIEFGRKVLIDEIVFYLRADFPHDAWWQSASVNFSDGETFTANFIKTPYAQSFKIKNKVITSLTIDNLIKADDPSPFPALTQIQVFGTEAE